MRAKLYAVLGGVLLLLLVPAVAAAQTISQSYGADSDLQRGMIVGLTGADRSKVEALASGRSRDIVGVVVSETDSAISLTGETREVYVASSGTFEVLVSDQNGSIEKGDYISLTAVEGVGGKANDTQPITVGRALESFNSSSEGATEATVSDADGKEKQIKLGRIDVDINIGKNPLVSEAEAPLLLQKIGETVAGKTVSGPRIYLALGVLIIAVGVAGSIIYGAVHSGLISIGRNPFSKGAIYQTMLQTIIIGFIIFFAALVGVYLLLRI